MQTFFLVIGIFIGFLTIVSLYRGVGGPGLWNRMAGISAIGVKTTVILVIIGFIYQRPDMFVDIALAYALLNFVAAIMIARYFEKRTII